LCVEQKVACNHKVYTSKDGTGYDGILKLCSQDQACRAHRMFPNKHNTNGQILFTNPNLCDHPIAPVLCNFSLEQCIVKFLYCFGCLKLCKAMNGNQ
jgi:hypothetical protein